MIRDLQKVIYGFLISISKCVLGKDLTKKIDVRFRFGKRLNLKNPETLSDKICYLENHCETELVCKCTDKWQVRNYVREKGLEEILLPVYGQAWTDVNQIDFDLLPNQFALKATHGCKMNYICADKKTFDEEKCKKEIKRWLRTTYGGYSCEWHYQKIPHRFYCEKFLENAQNLIDYKIHCINGQPAFILVCSERVSSNKKGMKVTLDLFDTNWNKIDALCASGDELPGTGNIQKPSRLDEMLQISKVLSQDFQFVRVDLYEVAGKVYFGELTFTPANGVFPYFTDEFNREMGKKLRI